MLQTKNIGSKVADWIKKKTHLYAAYKRHTSELKTHRLKVRGQKKIFYATETTRKWGQQYSYQIKQTLKQNLKQKTEKGII